MPTFWMMFVAVNSRKIFSEFLLNWRVCVFRPRGVCQVLDVSQTNSGCTVACACCSLGGESMGYFPVAHPVTEAHDSRFSGTTPLTGEELFFSILSSCWWRKTHGGINLHVAFISSVHHDDILILSEDQFLCFSFQSSLNVCLIFFSLL